ncbi:MAG: nitroreductase family deazaflavin-dependent oxidoreductase [Ardenticatenales bacterium]|nr:nitroreductase family deazaflavin-dependent oxidoreductase [Ardenticatenales bacterium]
MDSEIKQALDRDLTIDITTYGRKSGEPRRVEIWFKRVGGRTYITGTPGPRSWYANMLARPEIIFHLKESVRADLPATVRPVLDPAERQRILNAPVMDWYHQNSASVADFIAHAPLVEVVFED